MRRAVVAVLCVVSVLVFAGCKRTASPEDRGKGTVHQGSQPSTSGGTATGTSSPDGSGGMGGSGGIGGGPSQPGAPGGAAGQDGGSAAGGSRLAAGLYDLPNGVVQAVGTLRYLDIEGGTWAITRSTDSDEAIAVVANAIDLEGYLKKLSGKTVMAKGVRLDGASIRMAGPEIEISDISEVSDTGGTAE